MRRNIILGSLIGCGILGIAWAQEGSGKPATSTKLETVQQKGSYGIGLSIGSQLRDDDIEVDLNVLLSGIRDGLSGSEPQLSEEELKEAMVAFQQEVEKKAMQKREAAGEKNKQEGEAFLAKNAKKAGVKTTNSGLQYEVVKEGDGAVPKETDKVRTHYKGTLIDGTVFDSSYDRGQPAEFPVNGVIKGWVEALQLMKVGSQYRLYIPSDLAYGERGAGSKIGPNSVLIFDIELLGILD